MIKKEQIIFPVFLFIFLNIATWLFYDIHNKNT